MLVVELAVPSGDFIDTVNQIGLWLADERIEPPFSIYSGDKLLRKIRMGFARDGEGQRFAARFGGDLLPWGDPRQGVPNAPLHANPLTGEAGAA